jgi:hypothetical protein
MSGAIDNSELIARFMPETDDGDQFLYTELLDRSKRSRGSNRVRILRTFFHRSRQDFWNRWPVIKELCEQTGVRAYTRIAPRSYAKVGKLFAQKVVETALAGNFNGMAYLYSSACGSVTPNEKLWLWDVDDVKHDEYAFLQEFLYEESLYVAHIPSRQGVHLISKPFYVQFELQTISLHKDNPVNLFIPAPQEPADG